MVTGIGSPAREFRVQDRAVSFLPVGLNGNQEEQPFPGVPADVQGFLKARHVLTRSADLDPPPRV